MFKGVRHLVKLTFKYDKKYIYLLIIGEVLLIVSFINSLYMPMLIIDSIFYSKIFEETIKYLFIYLILGISTSFFRNIVIHTSFKRKMLIYKEFQKDIGNIIMKTDFAKTESKYFLELKQKAEKFIYGNGTGFGKIIEDFVSLIGKLIRMLIVVVTVINLNFFLIIFLFLIIIINSIATTNKQKREIKLNFEKVQHERRSTYFSNLFQDFRFGKEIRVFNLGNYLLEKYDIELLKMQQFYTKIADNNIKNGIIVIILSFTQQVLSYVFLIYEVINTSITIGQFNMYLAAINNFTNILKDIISVFIDMHQYANFYEYYIEYVNLYSNEKEGFKKIDITNLNVEFKNVSFRYDGAEQYALKNVNIKISTNEKIMIVGKNGAGKSTFVKLLVGLYKPTSGNIYINGVDIQELDSEQYSTLFSVLFQDFKLFSMSIRDNIKFDKNINDEYIKSMFIKLGMADKLGSLNEGLDTFIFKDFNKCGFEPSGGEAQKLALIRSICNESNFIILDEPTASLDPISENIINSTLDDILQNRTCIYITHKLINADKFNNILVFDNSELLEYGTHKTLLNNKQLYFELYNIQAGNYS